MIERTTVRLPSELLDRARRKAAAEGLTLTALIEEGLRFAVSRIGELPHEPKLPAVSIARGWLRDGIDPRCLEETEELERLDA